MTSKGTAAARYAQLEHERRPFLNRAREAAKVTIPFLCPPDGHTATSELDTPYQSIGSRGVRTLSSKLTLSLLPPNSPFFKYAIDDYTVEEIADQEGTRGEIEAILGKRSRAVLSEIEKSMFRPLCFEAVRHLLVTGNHLLYIPHDPKKRPRDYRLESYVVSRDASGNLMEIITHEKIAFRKLPKPVQKEIKAQHTGENGDTKDFNEVDLYTHVRLEEDGKFHEYQEAGGVLIEKSRGSYLPDTLPYIPLRFTAIAGEDYGRSFIEEFLGDLLSLEGLTQAVLEATAMASKVVFLVNPNGYVDADDLQEAPNGGFVDGMEEEVTVLQVDKRADLATAQSEMADIRQRLSLAFLMHQAVQRDAERVTAAEIRSMTEELDDALGGVYSLLSVELQLPIVKLFQRRMERAKNLPKLPSDAGVRPVIVTGIDALGRGQDLSKLDQFVAGAAEFAGPEQLGQFVNLAEYFKRRAAALGIDTEGLVVDAEERAAQMQQEQMMGMVQQLLPEAMKQAGSLTQEGMKQSAETERQSRKSSNE